MLTRRDLKVALVAEPEHGIPLESIEKNVAASTCLVALLTRDALKQVQ